MARLIALILAVCVPTIMLASAAVADGAPSQWAEEMPGAEGTFAFKPTD